MKNAALLPLFSQLAVLLFVGSDSLAQTAPPSWQRADWPVLNNSGLLQNPWVGGLTAPQWSPFDADLDGDEDLFAFDRDGSRILLFERIPSESDPEGELVMRWDWVENWPEMVDWCLLRDYNCDGKPDIFTSHQNGIRVYENTTEAGGPPSFDPDPVSLSASFDFGTGASDLPVICIGMDLPAILDHDDDGDLDIITFTETATTLYRFQGQTPCGLDLVCTNRCYGMLAEASENNALFIGPEFDCSFNVADPRHQLHAGGAITSLQLEPGGPKDLIISDVTYPTSLGVVMETGGSNLDSAVFVDTSFPANLYGDQEVNLPRFPAAFHLDVDQDGVRDLLFSPNTPLETNDDESVHFFRNAGTEEAPLWEFTTDTYVQAGMVDLGRGAYPSFHDFDGDGLLDLAVANKERYEGVDQTPAAVAAYRNVGTAESPSFELVTLDWINLVDFQIESPYPAFGDLDGDGDLDVLVGDELGRIHQFDNVAEPGNWPEFNLVALSLPDSETGEAIDVGQFATPQLLDMDGDGDLDMVVGEKNGTLTLIERSSLGTWSVYTSPVNGENWGGVLVDNLLGINGYSVPALTPTLEGLRVYVANETGTVQDFGLASEDWDAVLAEQEADVFGGRNGFRAAASFADLNGDDLIDAVVGIQNGGLLAYRGGSDTASVNLNPLPAARLSWRVMPNPGTNRLAWESSVPWSGELAVYNSLGQRVTSQPVQHARDGSVNAGGWPAGMYFVHPIPEGSGTFGNEKGVPTGTPLTWIKMAN
jgi:hypothetical protein